MSHDPSDPSIRLSRELLLGSFVVLVVPAAATLFLPDAGPGRTFLWFLALLPVLLWSYAFQWRGATTALAFTLVALLTAQAGAAARGYPPTPLLVETAITLLGIGLALALVMDRIQRDRGAIEEVALTDRLTTLPNRRHARVFLETMFGAAERGRPVSVVLFDLDDFRQYNDRMGTREGDEALRAFAALLATSTRRMNLSARLGGEEFMSILSGADEEGARAFADRVRETFRLSRPASRELTVSAGVAAFHPSMRRPDELVGAADLALFRSKEEGGDRVRVFGRDVRSRDAEVLTTSNGAARGPRDAAPESPSATDFARPAEEIGTSPPRIISSRRWTPGSGSGVG
jgi:diguanylate cyclase (GGDEF)-like protein